MTRLWFALLLLLLALPILGQATPELETVIDPQAGLHPVDARNRLLDLIDGADDDDLLSMLQGARCSLPPDMHPMDARAELFRLIDGSDEEDLPRLYDAAEHRLSRWSDVAEKYSAQLQYETLRMALGWIENTQCDQFRQRAKDCWKDYNRCRGGEGPNSASCDVIAELCRMFDDLADDVCEDGDDGEIWPPDY